MIGSTAVTEIRARLQELAADFWTSTEVLNALNEGVKRFAAEERWPWLQTVVTNGSLTTPWTDFPLPENYDPTRVLNLAVYFSGDERPRRVQRVSPAEGFERLQRDYQGRSEPVAYFVASATDADSDGQYIYTATFVPKLNRNATIKYIYFRVPALMTGSTESMDIPEEYAMGPIAYATGLLWTKELQDSRKAEEQFALYAQVVDSAKKNFRKFPQDSQFSWGGERPVRALDYDYIQAYRSIESAGGLGLMALPGDPRKTLVKQPSTPWRAALERWIRIIQGNFDHMDGVITEVQKRHNQLDDNVQELTEFVNENLDSQVGEHTHADDTEGGVLPPGDHDSLTGVSVNDHHNEDHDHDGTPTQKLLAANTHQSPDPDTHHSEDHDIDGVEHTNFPGGTTDFLREDGTWATPAGSGSVTQMSDLSDVDTTVDSATGGESLVYNGGASQWQAQTLNNRLDGLADVAVTEGPGIDTYVLTWDDGLASWVASAPSGGPGGGGVAAYVWSSRRTLINGATSAFIHATAAGEVDYVYIDLAGTSVPSGTIQVDVKLNGTSLFTGTANPTLSSSDTDGFGGFVSADFAVDANTVAARDQFQVIIDNKGGAIGRLKCYIVMV